jgi:hypothetical protein
MLLLLASSLPRLWFDRDGMLFFPRLPSSTLPAQSAPTTTTSGPRLAPPQRCGRRRGDDWGAWIWPARHSCRRRQDWRRMHSSRRSRFKRELQVGGTKHSVPRSDPLFRDRDRQPSHTTCRSCCVETALVTSSMGRSRRSSQVGRVVIEDDVEIGCNTTIDRGSLGTTRIGAGAKIDNLVQIHTTFRLAAASSLPLKPESLAARSSKTTSSSEGKWDLGSCTGRKWSDHWL